METPNRETIDIELSRITLTSKDKAMSLSIKYWTLLSLMFLSGHIYAAQVCTDGWEYRIVNLDDVDTLRVQKSEQASATQGLEAILNRLGRSGWEVMSNHELKVTNYTDLNGPTRWVAELVPSSVLLRRAKSWCSE